MKEVQEATVQHHFMRFTYNITLLNSASSKDMPCNRQHCSKIIRPGQLVFLQRQSVPEALVNNEAAQPRPLV